MSQAVEKAKEIAKEFADKSYQGSVENLQQALNRIADEVVLLGLQEAAQRTDNRLDDGLALVVAPVVSNFIKEVAAGIKA